MLATISKAHDIVHEVGSGAHAVALEDVLLRYHIHVIVVFSSDEVHSMVVEMSALLLSNSLLVYGEWWHYCKNVCAKRISLHE